MRKSASYRKEAWEILTDNFWQIFVPFVIYYVVFLIFYTIFIEPLFFALPFLPYVLEIFLWPLTYGLIWACLSFSRGIEISPKAVIEPYLSGSEFLRVLGANFVVGIFIFLWSLLLVIPGIIKSFSYALVPFIMKDNKEIGILDAITLSRKMMDGQKWRLCKLYLSFIGWGIVVMLTFGLATFFVLPYLMVAFSCFYNDVQKKYQEDQTFYAEF